LRGAWALWQLAFLGGRNDTVPETTKSSLFAIAACQFPSVYLDIEGPSSSSICEAGFCLPEDKRAGKDLEWFALYIEGLPERFMTV
jgi:hypothetical protein